MRVPPLWVRRALIAPGIVILALLMVASMPLWLLVALLLASLVPGFMRIPRILFLVTVYLVWDACVVVTMFVLWIASGFGWKTESPRFIRTHYVVGGFALRILFRAFVRVLRLRIITAGNDDDPASAKQSFRELFQPGIPIIVASRHGGPGDSFVIAHVLINRVEREPRIVLKDTFQWDPGIDVLLRRIPTRFITPTGFANKPGGGGSTVEQEISDLATGLDPNDALMIFPEGGQVSEARRQKRIQRLRDSGFNEFADRASEWGNVMPPQPGGVNAALTAAPDADMVFIAHTGLDQFQTLGDIWRGLPMDKQLTMRAWRVPRAEVPEGRDERAHWLFDWFETIDAWIEANNK